MRIIYMGSPESAVHPLKTLLEKQQEETSKLNLVAVVSQPAALTGRGRKKALSDPPVAAFAKQKELLVLQPEKARDTDFLKTIRELNPDVIITCAYGQILTQEFLDIPTRATINIHPSALPAFRGATPVPAALLAGETSTAVTVLFTVRALDAGALIVQKEYAIDPDETAGALTDRLFKASGPLLLEALEKLQDPAFSGTPQNPEEVSLCGKIKKEMGEVDWNQPASEIHNRYRAFHPWPGSWSELGGTRTTLTGMALQGAAPAGELQKPGDFSLSTDGNSVVVRAADTLVHLTRLKPAGGRDMDAKAFWNGYCQKKTLTRKGPGSGA